MPPRRRTKKRHELTLQQILGLRGFGRPNIPLARLAAQFGSVEEALRLLELHREEEWFHDMPDDLAERIRAQGSAS